MATRENADFVLKYYEEELFKNKNLGFMAVVQRQDELGRPIDDFFLKAGIHSLELQENLAKEINQTHSLSSLVPNSLAIPKNDENKFYKEDIVDVEIEETGEISSNPYTKLERPCRGGNSISSYKLNTAGTLGGAFKAKNNNGIFIISNWHILAGPHSLKGDNILQPGTRDGGSNPNNAIAKLIWKSLTPKRDAAIAKVISPNFVQRHTKCFGPLKKIRSANLHMAVKKCGRTTQGTSGTILSTNATVTIQGIYPGGSYLFNNQIMTTKMSTGGDSGSLLVHHPTNNVVGLLFGSNPTYSFANHIRYILKDEITIFNNRNEALEGDFGLEFKEFL